MTRAPAKFAGAVAAAAVLFLLFAPQAVNAQAFPCLHTVVNGTVSICATNSTVDRRPGNLFTGLQVAEGDAVEISVRAHGLTAGSLSVTLSHGTANNADINLTPGLVFTLTPSNLAVVRSYTIVDDTTKESDENFFFRITSANIAHTNANTTFNAGTPSQYGFAIIANDARTLTVTGPGTIAETDSDVQSGDYTIALADGDDTFTNATTVRWRVIYGTTVANDFSVANGTVSFGRNDRSRTFRVTVAGDDIIEGDESFTVQVNVTDQYSDGGTNYGAAAATTITDDDGYTLTPAGLNPPGIFGIDEGAAESSRTLLVRYDAADGASALAAEATVTLTVVGETPGGLNTAASGYPSGLLSERAASVADDFATATATCTIPANTAHGATALCVLPATIDDTLSERVEHFSVAVSGGPAGVQYGAKYFSFIRASDPIRMRVEGASFTAEEGDAATVRIHFDGTDAGTTVTAPAGEFRLLFDNPDGDTYRYESPFLPASRWLELINPPVWDRTDKYYDMETCTTLAQCGSVEDTTVEAHEVQQWRLRGFHNAPVSWEITGGDSGNDGTFQITFTDDDPTEWTVRARGGGIASQDTSESATPIATPGTADTASNHEDTMYFRFTNYADMAARGGITLTYCLRGTAAGGTAAQVAANPGDHDFTWPNNYDPASTSAAHADYPGSCNTGRGTVSFPAGTQIYRLGVTLNDDNVNEGDETIIAEVVNIASTGSYVETVDNNDGTPLGTDSHIAIRTIKDNDATTASIANAGVDADSDNSNGFQVEEGDNAVFRISLSKPSAVAVSVACTISGALTATDIVGTAPTCPVTIAAGETFADLSFPLAQDDDTAGEDLTVSIDASGHTAAGTIARTDASAGQSATQRVVSRSSARTLRLQRFTSSAYDTEATANALQESAGTLYFAVGFDLGDDNFANPTEITWTVRHDDTNGTSAADFTAVTGAITHPSGAACSPATAACRFQVAINDDNLEEAAGEGFSVVLSVADEEADGGTVIGDGVTGLSIRDNDNLTLHIEAVSAAVSEGGNAVVSITPTTPSDQQVTIDYSAVTGVLSGLGNTAATDDTDATLSGAGSDFGALRTGATESAATEGATVTFDAGQTSAELLVIPILADNLNEAAETFEILTFNDNITGAHQDPIVAAPSNDARRLTFTIAASDAMTASIERTSAATVNEGQTVRFAVVLAGATSGSVASIVVPYSVNTDGTGYTPTDSGNGRLTIPAGSTGGVIAIEMPLSTTLGDSDDPRRVTVTLTADDAATGATDEGPVAGAGGGVVTRGAPASAEVSVNFVDAAHSFTLTSPVTGIDETDSAVTTAYNLLRTGRAIADGQDLVITWAVAAGGATAADFAGGGLPGGTATFTGGATTATFNITIAGDNLNEAGEDFTLAFSIAAADQAAAATNGDADLPDDLTVTINDDDNLLITLDSGLALAGESSGSVSAFRLRLSDEGFTAGDVAAPFTLGGLDAGEFDITPASGLTINPDGVSGRFAFSTGTRTGEIVVSLLDDTLNEAAESLTYTGGPPVAAGAIAYAGGTNTASVMIADDDAITVTIAGPDPAAVEEGGTAEFSVTLTGAAGGSAGDITVPYTITWDNTAFTTGQFTDLDGGSIRIPAGGTNGRIRLRINESTALDDTDANEDLTVTLGDPSVTAGGGAVMKATGANSTATVAVSWVTDDATPPAFLQQGGQPGWIGGQRVLWVVMDEDFKVLPYPSGGDGAIVGAATPSLTGPDALVAGDFTVMENAGNPAALSIAVERVEATTRRRALRLSLARAIAADAANVNVIYERTAGGANAIYDTAVERGLARNNRRNATTRTSTGPLLPDTTADFDNDGMPDAAEIAIGENPLERIAESRRPVFSVGRTDDPNLIAYSGIREHGVAAHLGVSTVAAPTTQPAARTMTAYYRSDTFGYDVSVGEDYACRDGTGAFPANYAAPLSQGGCAPVDWGAMAPNTNHRIAWLAESADGVWAVDAAMNSGLPEQIVRRIPELNLAAQTRFTTDTTVVVHAQLEAVHTRETLTLTLLRTPAADAPATRLTVSTDSRTLSVEDASAVSSVWTIDDLTAGAAARLYRPATPTAGFTANHPAAATHYSLGLARRTQVVRVTEPVPPVLGRELLFRNNNPGHSVIALEDGVGAPHHLEVPVENIGDIGDTDPTAAATPLNGAVTVDGGNFLAASGDDPAAFRFNMTVGRNLLAAGTGTAAIQVVVTGGFGGVTTATYRFPVVAQNTPLTTHRRDGDGDGIADAFDAYEASDHLPVAVGETAGASAWHHIRPVLPLHDLRLGETTIRRLAMATANDEVDDYGAWSASTGNAAGNLAAVYDFEIAGVNYGVDADERIVGGVAGVIIPLPRSLYGSAEVSLRKVLADGSRVGFTAQDGNDYGFAPLQNGACPDDTGAAGGSYRDAAGALVKTRSGAAGDEYACLAAYIVDGGAYDADGMANGVIKDPLGVTAAAALAGGGGAARSHGGSFSVPALAVLSLLLLTLLRLRRRPPGPPPPPSR